MTGSAREGEGALRESERCGPTPHPDPLPAKSGAREKKV
jgi:hypothetical protein